ncbi:hypothetical protein BURPSPAST_C1350 [Burkholderia pseudomallei Pasteur 52237]|nr:hypothetical protein BURPSPAST_C1350 [Burkholderia pseudomallei Pasteur 52237]
MRNIPQKLVAISTSAVREAVQIRCAVDCGHCDEDKKPVHQIER